MVRLVVSLLGLAVLFALFAGTYYAPENIQAKTAAPSFQVGPGESQQVRLLPTIAGTPILVRLQAVGGPIDVFVMQKEWADRLADAGDLNLTQPFSYEAGPSRMAVNGTYEFTLVSDGQTEHLVLLDNSDAHYLGDAVPDPSGPTNGTVIIELTIHYLQEEERSLVLAYIAATPGVALVLFTIGHRMWRMAR
ncbi:MAG TPA: hypothetical protein VM286_07115 [Candidatus Thermoplasmatota archaeon]|nr:hypothetical protein [Candidatus Thermoplasmatota archaeon]